MNKQEIEKAIDWFRIEKAWREESEQPTSYIDMAITALEHQLTNGWVVAPPPIGTECLAQTVNDEIIHAYYAGDRKYHFVSYYDRIVQSEVKHWQPLPEPWKETVLARK